MAYEVEFTEEFEQWWNSLDADEQESIDFSVRLLEEQAFISSGLTLIRSTGVPGFRICVNFAVSTRDGPIAFSLPSIPGVPRSC